jgi:hypothetical protein
MPSILFIAIAALLTPVYARAQESSQPASQPASGPEGLACFENLVSPEFSKSALQDQVDGSVWTWTQVNPQGNIDKIETQVVSAWGQGEKLLTPPVEKAIRAAKIKSECAGKKVSVVFRYQLHGEATPNPKVTSKTEAPNIMDIESQPVTKTEVSSNRAPAKP